MPCLGIGVISVVFQTSGNVEAKREALMIDVLKGCVIKECIDRYAPLKLTKVTRPPAQWPKDPAIAELKEQRDRLRSAARASNNNKEEKIHGKNVVI